MSHRARLMRRFSGLLSGVTGVLLWSPISMLLIDLRFALFKWLENADKHTAENMPFTSDNLKFALVTVFVLLGLALVVRPPGTTLEQWQARVAREYPDVTRISTHELADWLQNSSKPRPLLLDVRTPEEYAVSHLPGAKLLPPGTSMRQLGQYFGTNTPAILYCSIGYRAAEMARHLKRAGWHTITVLDGSIFKWAREGRSLYAEEQLVSTVHPYSPAYAHLLAAEQRADLPGVQLWWHGVPEQQRWRWVIAIGLVTMLLAWESFAPAYGWFKNRRARLGHFGRNYMLGAINVVLAALVFAQFWVVASRWAEYKEIGLLHWLGLPGWARVTLAVLLLDLATYGWHWLNHRSAFLWRFHRTHHSETHLDVSSAARFHFGEIMLSGFLRIPVILLLGLRFHELVIYEIILFAVVQFHHANISLPAKADWFLSRIIATPRYHRVHHSVERSEADSNYSSMLTIWDRLFGTQSGATTPRSFGVEGISPSAHRTVVGMIESPLEK